MTNLKQEGWIDRAKGRIRSTWGSLTDDDVEQAKGNVEKLIGRIKEKTGETAEDIRSKLDSLVGSSDDDTHPYEPGGDGQVGGTHHS